MEGEREELTRKYFPQIQHFCNQYGVHFVAVDMRWGITSEASSNSQVINICLREVDRSDFFAGFFGQRYGWHGRDDTSLQENFDNAVGRYPWLEDVRDKSVTELEFLHGHLNNPGILPAVICFRDKVYDDKEKERGLQKGDKKEVFKYSAESELSSQLMEDLKNRCHQTKEKTYGVHLNYSDPIEGAKIMFDAIWKFLNKVLPKQQTTKRDSKRSIQLAQHDAFLASRHKMYGVGDNNLSSLVKLLNQESPTPMFVTGPSGIGKSTLLSLFISTVKSEYRSQFSLAYHCVGHAEESTSPGQILNRLVKELESASDVMEGKEEKREPSEKTKVEDVRDIINKLAAAISKIQSKGKQSIIIIDGVEKVIKTSRTEEVLFWLPHKLPEGTIFIVSANSLQSEIEEELVSSRSFNKLEIQDLSEEMRQDFAVRVLMEPGKELSPSQMQKIVQTTAAKNPLYLKVLLNELIVFGYFRLLDKKIDSLVKCESVDELFEKVLERLEEDGKEFDYDENLVEQVTCVIGLSRQGLSEAEVTSIFNIPSHVWSPFFYSMESYFISQRGLIQFGFQELKEAVKRKFLSEKNVRKYTQCIADYFEKQLQQLPKVYKAENKDVKRISSELPFAYQFLNDKVKLAETLTHLSVLAHMREQYPTELYDLWESTGFGWSEITEKYLTAVDVQVADLYIIQQEQGTIGQKKTGFLVIEDLWNIFHFLDYVHHFDGCEKALRRVLDICTNSSLEDESEREFNRESALYYLAITYHNNSKIQDSLRVHLQVLKLREGRMPDLTKADPDGLSLLGNSYNGIGTNYLIMGEYAKCIEYLEKSLECSELADDKNSMAIVYLNISNAHSEMLDNQKAMDCLQKATQYIKDVYFGHQPLMLGLLYNNLGLCCRRLNRLEEAEKYYQMSLDVKRNTVGDHHPLLCQTFTCLSAIETLKGNLEKALEYSQKAAEIYKRNDTPENDMFYVRCRENIILHMIELKRRADADELYTSLFELLEREMRNGNNHLIDGTIPFVHVTMVKYLIENKRDEEARRVLTTLLKTKAVSPIYHVLLKDVLDRQNPGDKAPENEETEEALSIDEAIKKWPTDRSLLEYKFRNLINTENSLALIDFFNSICPLFNDVGNLYNFVLQLFATTERFNNKMFIEFNENALSSFSKDDISSTLNCLRNTAESYEREKQLDKALGYYKQWTELEKDNPLPFFKVSYCLALASGNIEGAKKYCKEAREKAELEGQNQENNLLPKIVQLWGFLEEAEQSQNEKQ
ncbi:TPR repeat-containing protein DDB_G0287407-like [Crassostrea virginica]